MLLGPLRHSYLWSVYPDSSLTLPFIPSVSGLHDFCGSNPQFLRPLKWAASVAALFSISLSMTLYNPQIWIFLFLTETWQQSTYHTPLLNCVRGVLFYQPASDVGLYTEKKSMLNLLNSILDIGCTQLFCCR